MKLLIAEKPSVANNSYRKLLEAVEGERFVQKDGYLQGKEYVISWCVGHLVGLAEPSDYTYANWKQWNLSQLPMIPTKWEFKVLPNTQKQYNILADLCTKADLIINGGDAGREGELIVFLVLKMSGCLDKPQKRLWLSSFVQKDMEVAWGKMKGGEEYKNLAAAACARAQADWLVGMNFSRGYSMGTNQKGLSVGRVQTPTLKLVVDRDFEIENWEDKKYYQLLGFKENFKFTFTEEGEKKFPEDTFLKRVQKEVEGREGKITVIAKKNKTQNPPKLFDLTELQKVANKRFGYKAAQTLEIAQKLYEAKIITYPRTDSAYLPESMKKESFNILRMLITDNERPYLKHPTDKFIFFNSKKVTDHFAIIPTSEFGKIGGRSDTEKKIFALVKERYMQAFMKPHVFVEYNVEAEIEKHLFTARILQQKDMGFKEYQKKMRPRDDKKDNEDQDESFNNITAPLEMKKGDPITFDKTEITETDAKKPQHFTEATLLTAMNNAGRKIENEELAEAMKERGLGTPATKASIIETLKNRKFIQEKGKKLISTEKGRNLIHFVDDKVKSPEMTGEWEYKLSQISKGDYEYRAFMEEIKKYITSMNTSYTKYIYGNKPGHKEESPLCPKCRERHLQLNNHGLFCVDSCGFKVWAKIAKKPLDKDTMFTLVRSRKTPMIQGFKKKNGEEFAASLFLDAGYNVKFGS